MSCYVDELFCAESRNPQANAIGRWTGHRWCHLWADSERELHEFARKILLRRDWFQLDKRLPHYELTPSKRAQAIYAGAIPASLADWLRRRENRIEQVYRYQERVGMLCGKETPNDAERELAAREAQQWFDQQKNLL